MNKATYVVAALCALSFGSLAQNSESNEVFIKQLVGANQADVEQGAAGGFAKDNLAKVLQEGDGNDADIFQGLDGGTAEENTATLAQVGDDNDTDIFQGSGIVSVRTSPDNPTFTFANPSATTALRSEATISQHGDDHYAAAVQAGSADDIITIEQSGVGSFARVAQGATLPN